MNAQRPSSDPVEGFLEQSVADLFGPSRAAGAPGSGTGSGSSTKDAADRWFPLCIAPALALGIGVFASDAHALVDRVGDTADVGRAAVQRVTGVIDWIGGHLTLIVGVCVVAVVVDLMRWYARQHRRALAGQVYATTYIQPRSVYVPWPPGWRAVRRAVARMPQGSVIAEKRYTALVVAITAAANTYRGAQWSGVIAVRQRFELAPWVMHVDWQAGSGRLVVTRSRDASHSASRGEQRRRLDAVLGEKFPLPDARVTAVQVDDNGAECGFTISHSPSIRAAVPAVQQALREALTSFLVPHASERVWTVSVFPERDTISIALADPILTWIAHTPLEDYAALSDKDRWLVPYATGAGGVLAMWNIAPSSSAPHMLVSGPTGAGKTSLIRTVITEAILRGVPILAIDPKMIELDGMEGYPGVVAVVYNLRQIVALINAVHAEMLARREHIYATKMPSSTLPIFGVVMDEFFVMGGFLRRALKYSGEDPHLNELKNFVADSATFGKIAEILALIRSLGGRIVMGVQRPDAKNFGEDAGSVRDNFGTRASAANLSQDGAVMLWGDAHIGRDLDTSIPGRATVSGPDGAPMTAQVHWTPDVDDHPNKWERLNATDRQIVTALREATGDGPSPQWFSAEMRSFLAEVTGTRPEPPTVIDGANPTTVGDDGLRAEMLSVGDRVVDDGGHVLTVESVDVANTTVRARLVDPDRPRVTHEAEYEPTEIVLTA